MIDDIMILHSCIAFFDVIDRQNINARQRVKVISFSTFSLFPQVLADSSFSQFRISLDTVTFLSVDDTHQRVRMIRL